jgi:hypothetical protein
MTTQKFELYGSTRSDRNGTEAFLSSKKGSTYSFNELVEILCRSSVTLKKEKCVGYKITNDKLTLLFEE